MGSLHPLDYSLARFQLGLFLLAVNLIFEIVQVKQSLLNFDVVLMFELAVCLS